jgi:LIM domain
MAGQKSISSKDGRLSGRYHKQCFACHTCRGHFETADFYVHDDHPFCAEHYHALNGSLCSGCGKGIEGQYLEATNKAHKQAEKFHPKCLTCSSCRISLQDDYFEWMGKVYCERDAKQAAGVPMQSPSDAFLSPRPSPSPGSNVSTNPSSLGRPGLPSGPRAGLRPPVPGQAPGSGNGFLFPFPPNGGLRAPPSGGRFPERRTTKLMMM